MSRADAEQQLASRGNIAGDFVVRESKGIHVISVWSGATHVHNEIAEAGRSGFDVNGKHTVTGASTVIELLEHYLAAPEDALLQTRARSRGKASRATKIRSRS